MMKKEKEDNENRWEGQEMFPVTRDELNNIVPRKERKGFKLPKDFDEIEWDKIPFLAWKHPSGHKSYLLEQRSGNNRLWVLDSDTKVSNNKKACMCSLCLYVHTMSSGTSTFCYTPKSNPNKKIGFSFCSDLQCMENATKLSVNSMRETITDREKRVRLLENLDRVISVWDA